MRKKLLVLFAYLLLFGIVISTAFDAQHLFACVLFALAATWFWRDDLVSRLPVILPLKEILLISRSLVMMLWYIAASNFAVAKTLLAADPPASPVILVFQPDIKSDWGRVFLAACITITPGTVTVDVAPETGHFVVHALTEKTAEDLPHWQMINEIKKMEIIMQGRKKHALDAGRAHGIDSTGAIAGHYRTHNH